MKKKSHAVFLGIAQSLESGKEFSHVQIVLGATAIYHVVSGSTDLFVVLNAFLEIRSPVSFQMGIILLLAIEAAFHFPPEPHVIQFPQTKEIKFLAIRLGNSLVQENDFVLFRERIPIGRPEGFGSSLGGFCRVLKSVYRGLPFVVFIFKEIFDHFPLFLHQRALCRRTVGVLDLPSVFDFRHLAGLISSGYGERSKSDGAAIFILRP